MLQLFFLLITFNICAVSTGQNIPIVITTWNFANATIKGKENFKKYLFY